MTDISTFHLIFVTRGKKQPPLSFDGTFDAVFNTANKALADGYYEHENKIIALGEDTAVHLLSAEALSLLERGLVVDEWNVVIETPLGHVLPPIPYKTKEDATLAVCLPLRGTPHIRNEAICCVKTQEHEVFWYVPTAGATFHILNKEECIQRVQAAPHPQANMRPANKIII